MGIYYTALEEMWQKNIDAGQLDAGPEQPVQGYGDGDTDLKGCALRFIRESCVGLRFCMKKNHLELADHDGTSAKPGQIPYNMQMDIDRACLEKALERFLDSGSREDAFDVYFCYLDMFFGGYQASRRMIELLSEYEVNASSVLMKHRDHYVHSVYVFALGLAIFESNGAFREAYREYEAAHGWCGDFGQRPCDSDDKYMCHMRGRDGKDCGNGVKLAHRFLKYWGLASLFHDIGYPFELPVEQVKSYFDERRDEVSGSMPYLAYRDMDGFVSLSDAEQKMLVGVREAYAKRRESMGAKGAEVSFETTDDVFAYALALEFDVGGWPATKGVWLNVLKNKATNPQDFGGFLDHAYFSATLLLKQIMKRNVMMAERESRAGSGIQADCEFHMDKPDTEEPRTFQKAAFKPTVPAQVTTGEIDALVAILLHNSIYKFLVAEYKEKDAPCDMYAHPMAFMLMLCDELQCWDRTSYGRNSRTELHPAECKLRFEDGSIQATYQFDESGSGKIAAWRNKCAAAFNEWDKKCASVSDESHRKESGQKCLTPSMPQKPKLKAYSQFNTEWEGKLNAYSKFDTDMGRQKQISVGSDSRPIECEIQADIERIVRMHRYWDAEDGRYIKLEIKLQDSSKHWKAGDGEVSIGDGCQSGDKKPAGERKHSSLSRSNFIHLYNFAAALNARYSHFENLDDIKDDEEVEKQIYNMFESLSLEYKLSNVRQAKMFGRYLAKIHCIYTDQSVDLEELTEFSQDELDEVIGPWEHHSWNAEKKAMGWKPGSSYENSGERERMRIHKDMDVEEELVGGTAESDRNDASKADVTNEAAAGSKDTVEGSNVSARNAYERLDADTQKKDTDPMNKMIELLHLFDGLRIYRLPGMEPWKGDKRDGCQWEK